jgi:transposase
MSISPEAAAIIAALQEQIKVLQQDIAELRHRLGLDSSNSGKPPSSDGLGKKPRIMGSLRGKSGKKSGGQEGHKGGTLRQSATPDIIKKHAAKKCEHCAACLTHAMITGVEKRQVFDMPEPRLIVTEHQARIYSCTTCHDETRAAFPANVTSSVQYGERIKAAALYLNVQHLVPEDRTADIMGDLFGADLLCPASITAWAEKKAAALKDFIAHIAALVAGAPVKHLDETGFRIGGKTQWLHTASTHALTHYRVTEKRGALLETLNGGVIIHDHFKPYYTLPNVEHALCNAHHLRELKALVDIEKEPWAKKMAKLLRIACHAVNRAVQKGATLLAERALRRLHALYDAIIAEGLLFHEQQPALQRKNGANGKARGKSPLRIGHNLLIRLRDFKNDALRFMHNVAVPFTNNQAEQDLRMMKVRMKISGGFRTMDGATTFATLRSVLSTARKQGWNILQTLVKPTKMLIAQLAD